MDDWHGDARFLESFHFLDLSLFPHCSFLLGELPKLDHIRRYCPDKSQAAQLLVLCYRRRKLRPQVAAAAGTNQDVHGNEYII